MLSKNDKKPNILIIYPDQMRADAMGCSGNPTIKTPFCDRLAQEGVRFEQAYTSFPLCTPFRASFFTGKYSSSNGVYANHYPIPLKHDFLAEILKNNGYQTGYIGKWHLGGGDAPGFIPPGSARLGFDHFVGFNRGHDYMNSIYYKDTNQPYHCARYEADFQTDHMIDFLEKAISNNSEKPFFGFICYGAPHYPFKIPDYFKNLYRPEEVVLGPTAGNTKLQKEVVGKLKEKNFQTIAGIWGIKDGEKKPEWDDEKAVREFLSKYYGMVANVDHNVGILLNWLDKKGVAEDTMVILLSDHGDMAGEHGYRCAVKKTCYRQSMQVPMIVRYPKRFPSGHVVQSLVDVSVDTMPTVLEMCGIKIPEDIQGKSFLSLLEGGTLPSRKEVFYQVHKEMEGPERFPEAERGIRTKDWLYCRTQKAPKLLFDLQNDPHELHNLIFDEQYKIRLENLDNLLKEYMARYNDDWSIEAVFPPPDYLTHQEKADKQKELLKRAIWET